ncbi:MAG: hypothetical protein HY858_12045 [Candidatus Solibacter usitatus]|nr:hypothetical protein [Candidatus Solibacter usitatus]
MKKLGLFMMLAAVSAFAGEMTGYISESKCGAKHADGSDGSIKCVSGCIKGGAKPVLVVDGKVLSIVNPEKVAEALYGKKVNVTAHSDGKSDSVTLDKIAAAN